MTIDKALTVSHEFSNIEITVPDLETISKSETSSYFAIGSFTSNSKLQIYMSLVNFTAHDMVHDVAGILTTIYVSRTSMDLTNITFKNIESYTYTIFITNGLNFKFTNLLLESKIFRLK